MAIDHAALAESMAIAVRAKTVTGLLDPTGVAAEYDRLHAHLKARYPLVHATLEREVVGGHSLLFTWRGSAPQAKPIALLATKTWCRWRPATRRCGSSRRLPAWWKAVMCGAAARWTTKAT